jgi:pimeloyl-ACP methyl ester carboxylesterase
MLQRWPGAGRGRLLLIHGLASLADSWWRIGPALAADGWDVTAVDQAGHGGRPVAGEVTPAVLAAAVREVVPEPPDVLIGHSLGTVTALALPPALTTILEEPPSARDADTCATIARGLLADVAAVRADRAAVVRRVRDDNPRWADEDVHWAVEGIAQIDAEPFARRFATLAGQSAVERIRDAYVLAGTDGSVLNARDRTALSRRLIEIEGGHCLHRDAPDDWLASVLAILRSATSRLAAR